ncbi:replication/maintenance protein RepL, partial [Klebsiella pneumoniae]
MMLMTSQMGRNNALVASQATLAKMAGCGLNTLKRALSVLREGNWIEVRQIGPTGTACAYIVNDRVAWSGNRDGIRYSLFSAAVLL